jgi:hypothetical protein
MTSVPNGSEPAAEASPEKCAWRLTIPWRLVAGILIGYAYYAGTLIFVAYGLKSAWGALAR